MLVNLCLPKWIGFLPCVMLMWGRPLVYTLHTIFQWLSDLQFDNGDFALDSKRVVDHVNSYVDDNSEFGCIIVACRRLLHNSFQNSHFEFNRRQVIGVTHKLTHAALLNPSSHVIDDAPSCI